MQKIEPIEEGHFYHLYNCGINGENLFRDPDNYEYFMHLYEKYIDPVADTFSWCLMPNHFHLLIRVKEQEEITSAPDWVSTPDRVSNPVRGGTASRQLSKLFNAYAQAYNKRHQRYGSLFRRPFRRKKITSEEYLRNVIVYIHNNPVHHGFAQHAVDYPWSSYLTCISIKPTKLQRETVIGWFDDLANFKYLHNKKGDIISIEKYLNI